MSSFRRKVKTTETDILSLSFSLSVPVASSDSELSSEIISNSTSSQEIVSSGWKPWIFTGQGIISTGHRELDELLGGGLPLSSLNLYETETLSNYGKILLSYSLAEGLSHGHDVLLIGSSKKSINDFISLLPRNMKIERDSKEIEETSMKSLNDSIVLDEEDKKESENSNDLKIAWQYKKYIQKNQVPKREKEDKLSFCCSYDLSEK